MQQRGGVKPKDRYVLISFIYVYYVYVDICEGDNMFVHAHKHMNDCAYMCLIM